MKQQNTLKESEVLPDVTGKLKRKRRINKMLRIDKNLCNGCGTCANVCPNGFEMKNGKSVIKNPNVSCISKAISLCPVKAIKLDSVKDISKQTQSTVSPNVSGKGRGMGRGLGLGPKDGRGRGRGGGGRGM